MNAPTTSTVARAFAKWRGRIDRHIVTIRVAPRDTRTSLKQTPWQKLFALKLQEASV